MSEWRWPAKEAFGDHGEDPSRSEKRAMALASQAAKALAHGDLAAFSDVSRIWPMAAFEPMTGPGGQESKAIDELEALGSSEAFDAGLAWGAAAGRALEGVECQAAFKRHMEAFFELGPRGQRHVLAFASGALQTPRAPASLADWARAKGEESFALKAEFGAVELGVWGQAWESQARQEGRLDRWCERVLARALSRWREGAEGEARQMLDACRVFGDPPAGWLSRAWSTERHRVEEECVGLRQRLARSMGSMQSREEAAKEAQRQKLHWLDLAGRACLGGPSSWMDLALDEGAPAEFLAAVESWRLRQASAGPAVSSAAPRL